MAEINFDSTGIEPQGEFTPIPVGEYTAIITKSELKDTKDYTGKRLNLEVEIVEGKYKSRKIWQGLNIQNKSADTVAIAKRELAAITIACGFIKIRNTEELQNKPVLITVGIKPADGQYDAQNVIKAWKSKTAQAQPVPQKVGDAPTNSKPWEQPKAEGQIDIF